MTKVLLGKRESDTRFNVSTIHYQPNKLTAEQKSRGIEVEDIAIPEKPTLNRGEGCSLFANPQTKEVWYEKVTRKLNEKEEMEVMNEKIDRLETKIDELNTKLKKIL